MGTSRILIPGWLASAAFLGVVALYLYSIGPGDYRFPTLWALFLFVLASGLLIRGGTRARATADLDRRTKIEPKAGARHNRMMLAIAYSGACALLVLPAGLAGNDRAWHGLMDGDPQVVETTAGLVTDVRKAKSGWTGDVDGHVEADGTSLVFNDQEVAFDDDPSAVHYSEIELWVVFDPDDLGAGYVVAGERDGAENLIGYPFLPLPPFILIVIGAMWLVHHWLSGPSRFERFGPYANASFAAINPVPRQVWVFVALWGAVFYVMPFAYMLSMALSPGPFTNAPHKMMGSFPIAGMLLLAAVPVFAMVVYHAGMDSWAGFRAADRPSRSKRTDP